MDNWSEVEATSRRLSSEDLSMFEISGDENSCMILLSDTNKPCGKPKVGVLGMELLGRSISVPICRDHLRAASANFSDLAKPDTPT